MNKTTPCRRNVSHPISWRAHRGDFQFTAQELVLYVDVLRDRNKLSDAVFAFARRTRLRCVFPVLDNNSRRFAYCSRVSRLYVGLQIHHATPLLPAFVQSLPHVGDFNELLVIT